MLLQNAEGAILGPFDCWLALRGLATMALRMERQAATCARLAQFLAQHPLVRKVGVHDQLTPSQTPPHAATCVLLTGAALCPRQTVLQCHMPHCSKSCLIAAGCPETAPQPTVQLLLQVNYPGLASHPGHAVHQRQATSGGSLLSFETGRCACLNASKHQL